MKYIAMPRLHPEFDTSDINMTVLHLWGNLPDAPESVFIPENPAYPWNRAEAAQYLRDVMQGTSDFARGRTNPRESLADVAQGGKLTQEELNALHNWKHNSQRTEGQSPVSTGHDIPSSSCLSPEKAQSLASSTAAQSACRQTASPQGLKAAQSTLILAWLQEQQYLELKALELLTQEKSTLLSSLIHDPEEMRFTGELAEIIEDNQPEGMEKQAQLSTLPLPAWKVMLRAALEFLPEDVILVVNDAVMWADLLELDVQSRKDAVGQILSVPVSMLYPALSAAYSDRILQVLLPS